MTTRAELRTAVRQRLEDSGAGPLWDDAALNDALAGALRAYGARVPKEAVASVAVAAGATRVTVAAPVIDPGRIVRVLDGKGAVIGRMADGEGADGGDGGSAQGWRWWEGTLILRRPATRRDLADRVSGAAQPAERRRGAGRFGARRRGDRDRAGDGDGAAATGDGGRQTRRAVGRARRAGRRRAGRGDAVAQRAATAGAGRLAVRGRGGAGGPSDP